MSSVSHPSGGGRGWPGARTPLFGLGVLGTAVILGALAGMAPAVAVAATLGFAFLVAVFSDLALGVCLFAVLTFFEVLPTVAGGFSFAKIGGILLVLAWVAALVLQPQARPGFVRTHPAATALIAAFLTWIFLSATWAESAGTALSTLPRYAPNLALFFVIYTAIARRRDAQALVIAFVAGATIAALYGLANPPAADSLRGDRIGGTVGDPNELASVLVAGFALSVALFAITRRAALRWLAAVAAGLLLLGMLLTLSRGGLIALAVVMLVGVFSAGRWRRRTTVVALLAVIGTVTYFGALASPVATHRVTTAATGSGRTGLWMVGWRMVEAHPVRGIGVGNFPVSSVHYLLRPGVVPADYLIVDIPKVAHNVYLQVLAETGIVGLGLFLGILGFAITSTYRAAQAFERTGDTRMEIVARALLTAQAGMLAADFFISAQYNKQLWILLALGPALLAIARQDQTPAGAD